MTTTTRTYEIPVIVNATVTVDDAGTVELVGAYPDSEAAPWSFSSDPAAWDPDADEWHENGTWQGDEPWEAAATAAYDLVKIAEPAEALALDRIANLLRLPEWDSAADYCEWIAEIVGTVRDLKTTPAPAGLLREHGYDEEALAYYGPEGDTRFAGATLQYDEHGEPVVEWAECGACGERWNDALITGITPVPSGRCPFEADHEDAPEDAPETGAWDEPPSLGGNRV